MAYGLYRALSSGLRVVAAPWLGWKRSTGGDEWRERLGALPRLDGEPVWVHAASVGEVGAAEPVVRELLVRGLPVLVTTMTLTGRQAASSRFGTDVNTAFVPLDFVRGVRLALERVRPRALVLVESELWPNLVAECASTGVPVGLVNARLGEGALRRKALPGSPVRESALRLSLVACRDEADRERFTALGVPAGRVVVTGDTKFDTLPRRPTDEEREAVRASLGVPDGMRCVVFGSVRPREEEAVVRAVRRVSPGPVAVVAPRHMRRVVPLQRALERAGLSVRRRSDTGPEAVGQVVLVDTTGELAALYGAADVAFVGGTLGGYGGHNPLEPAALGVPVLFGPDTRNCASAARALIDGGGAVEVAGGDGLAGELVALLDDDARRSRLSEAAAAVVEAGRGAAARTVDALTNAGLLEASR
jgi:3-deoxy-D-manno-octulosonic-acid transferase